MFIAFLFISLYVFNKEGELQPFIERLHGESKKREDTGEYYVISKFPPHYKG
jgi:hypothetical protein